MAKNRGKKWGPKFEKLVQKVAKKGVGLKFRPPGPRFFSEKMGAYLHLYKFCTSFVQVSKVKLVQGPRKKGPRFSLKFGNFCYFLVIFELFLGYF